MKKPCMGMVVVATAMAVPATAAQGISGWVTDSNLATYVGTEPNTGSAHLPAFVRLAVDESQIAVVGWDIFTPERDDGLLSMLLSTTWESPMEPWPDRDDWFVSSHQMPMSDGSQWFLWYRRLGTGSHHFQLGAPSFIGSEQRPQYVVTDRRQRQWSFSQPFLVVPEPSTFAAAFAGLLCLAFPGRRPPRRLKRSRAATSRAE